MGRAYVIAGLDTGDALADRLDDTRRLVAENLHTHTHAPPPASAYVSESSLRSLSNVALLLLLLLLSQTCGFCPCLIPPAGKKGLLTVRETSRKVATSANFLRRCPPGVRAPRRGGGAGVGPASCVGLGDVFVVQVRGVVPVLAPLRRP